LQSQSFSQQNQQMTYTEPPNVITTKDLSYIDDMLAWNLLAMKKAHFVAEHCQNPALKTAFEACGQMHQRHYQKILNHLNSTQSH